MTQEQKAEAYDEAIERASKLRVQNPFDTVTQMMEHVFPELKKSEDALTWLTRYIEEEAYSLSMDIRDNEDRTKLEKLKKSLAWLEMQGEEGKITNEEICKSYGISDIGEFSDGYHTFNELYYYRMLYNAAFFNMLPKEWVHKSKKHHDGEECFGGGWFIVMVNLPTGQVSNHYELKYWDLFQMPEKETADEWDGHTPQEAADRLHKYLLEMQVEQKPILDFNADDWYVSEVDGKIHNIYHSADKVEPKFHEGDWVIDKQGIVHQVANVVENVTNHTYGYDIVGGGYFNDNNEGVRIWSIEDAEDGDVLVTVDDKRPFIYKGCLDPKHPNAPVAYCGIDTEDFFCTGGGKFNHWWTDAEVQPATKEQRDLLFQKMKEAEYEWDAEKKMLKKIEQKSAWSEDDEDAIGQAIVALEDMFDEDHPQNCYAGYKLSFIDAAERLKSLKDRVQLQNSWKPSDEQILALRWILNNIPYDRHKEEISGLLEQLKKLKGE